MSGARSRTRRATRWVNSGLSMMTRTSGFAAMTASAVSRIRQDFWKPRRDRRKADDREVPERKQARNAFGSHVRAADTGKVRLPLCVTSDRRNQCRAQPVPRLFAGDQKYMRAHAIDPTGTPTTNIPARSASSTTLSASAIMVLSETTAMPASPARETPVTVRGPIDGKSNR